VLSAGLESRLWVKVTAEEYCTGHGYKARVGRFSGNIIFWPNPINSVKATENTDVSQGSSASEPHPDSINQPMTDARDASYSTQQKQHVNLKKPALTRVQRLTSAMSLWPVTLTLNLWPQTKWGFPDSSLNISMSSLAILAASVFEISCAWTERQTHQQTPMKTVPPSMSSA